MDMGTVRTLNVVGAVLFGLMTMLLPLVAFFFIGVFYFWAPDTGVLVICFTILLVWIIIFGFLTYKLYQNTVGAFDKGNFEVVKRWCLYGLVMGVIAGVVFQLFFVIFILYLISYMTLEKELKPRYYPPYPPYYPVPPPYPYGPPPPPQQYPPVRYPPNSGMRPGPYQSNMGIKQTQQLTQQPYTPVQTRAPAQPQTPQYAPQRDRRRPDQEK